MNFVLVTAYDKQRAEWECFLSEKHYHEEHMCWTISNFIPDNFLI